MPGEQFSRSHVHPGAPGQDSTRARYRVGALFGETGINSQVGQLASYLGRELGVPVPGDGRRASNWHAFIRECPTSEFLDTITVIYRYLFWHAGEESANRWRKVCGGFLLRSISPTKWTTSAAYTRASIESFKRT